MTDDGSADDREPRFCIAVRQYRGDPRNTVAMPGEPHTGAGALTGGDLLADADFGIGEEWFETPGSEFLWKDETYYATYATVHSGGERVEGEPPGSVVELTTLDGEQLTLDHAEITEIEALPAPDADKLVADGGTATKPRFEPGDEVLDRDASGDPNPAVVVALPEEPAYERTITALDGNPSVADLNPNYGASGPVATVAYADDLDRALDVWCDAAPDALARICEDEGVRTYDFPTARLREVSDE